ncbi:MAG TPA: ATP-binding cassette domain-containing protein [Fimbriimonadaceae bacterium]|nr:ATP-binding cassette domain-containing protein [Fimbriimonadaceae bacterium]
MEAGDAMAEAALEPVVRLVGLGKLYGKVRAAKDLSFDVAPGTLYGLLGPDAAGKSSVLKSIAGVLSFEEGFLDVFGVRIDSERAGEHVKDRLGFMPQGLGLNLYPELTVEENVDFFADLRLVPRAEYAARKREMFEITRLADFKDRRMKHLSGGMKQKLGLVCALIHDPALLILDEPTTGVDPVSRRDFWTILSRQVHERGITAIVSTAYMDEASRFDRICLLHNGRQLAEGRPSEVVAMLPGSVVSLHCPDQTEALRRLRAAFARADARGDQLRVRLDAAADEAVAKVAEVVAGLDAEGIRVEEPTLDDTFVFMLGEKAEVEEVDSGMTVKRDGGEEAIVAHRLTKSYDDFVAVDRVSLTVQSGQIFGLLGANGAGKTTVIKMLTGIVPPTMGHGQVAGADMRRASLEVRRRIGYVSQAYSLYQDLTVRENILLYAGIYGLTLKQARRRVDWVLDFGGLHAFAGERSGGLPIGLRQRLALGCALVHEPRVLFLDEPTSGVDPLGRRTIWDLLFRLSREHGVAILVTTHYMSEAEHCDRLALMHAGRIVANASPETLKGQFRVETGALAEIDVGNLDRGVEVLAAAGFSPALYGRAIHTFTRDLERDIPRIRTALEHAGLAVRSVAEVPISMEDVFVYRIAELERGALNAEDAA